MDYIKRLFFVIIIASFIWTLIYIIVELVEAQAHSADMTATVELTESNALSTCIQEMCGHLK